jgi:hypothetical protein
MTLTFLRAKPDHSRPAPSTKRRPWHAGTSTANYRRRKFVALNLPSSPLAHLRVVRLVGDNTMTDMSTAWSPCTRPLPTGRLPRRHTLGLVDSGTVHSAKRRHLPVGIG